MIQVIPRVISGVEFGGQYWAAMSGGNQLSNTFGGNVSRAPMPWPATVRNLVVYTRDSLTQPLTVTVLKNLTGTALTVTLPAGTTGPVYATGIDVEFAQFDDIAYQAVTSGGAFPGWSIGVCLEVESQGNVFGINPLFGTFDDNEGGIAGALGNGLWSLYTQGSPIVLSGSYSICAVDGTITTLALKTFSGAPDPGDAWHAYLIKNLVVQDGSGGTVDTRCSIAEGETTGVSTFSLPVELGDHVDVGFYRSGATTANAAHVGVGVGFVPDEDGHFMITGGSTENVIEPLTYKWTYGLNDLTAEPLALVPIGPSGLIARGIYIERQVAPGVGETKTHTLRRNEANTLIAVTLENPDASGLKTGFQAYVQGQTMCLQVEAPGGTGDGGNLFWGLDATIEGVGPPASAVAVIGPHIWIVFYRTQPEIGT
jgi:hypothetical protein